MGSWFAGSGEEPRKGCVGTRRYSGGVRGEAAELRFSCEQTEAAERAAELCSWVSVHCGGR